ncbi:hypothetical protein F5Y13DRAFT_181723 [Hypoxylon sp. FL1857]|nr:hypothetical protein F5Y13DRAFT_181723 [Hypoxylon sp. FL1857]
METSGDDIVIVGSGCRFPGDATSPSKLWALLSSPILVSSEVSALEGYYHEKRQYHGHTNVKEAYMLAGDGTHRRFDAAFFGIKPTEANVLDPQIRLLLEIVYEALEDGGQTIDDLRGTDTAIYAGQMVHDYETLMLRDHENLGVYHATGTSRAMLSNRVSYFFDWHGPSMTIDTACSSSLVALHYAVQQLRSSRSRVAIVAGSNLIYDPSMFIAESRLQMLSPDGRSRMWDKAANGYARGEGVAAVVLKTRKAAEANGDHIECIIRETAINQDGRTIGQTMPSAFAQTQLIRDCYTRAGLDLTNPEHRPQYFEAHGTGTPTGDPIEAEAIHSAFFPPPSSYGAHHPLNPLSVGSIKTIIGHTEGTAGLAGLMRASLALQNACIPPNLLFENLSPRIRPFYHNLHIPTSLTPWPAVSEGTPRRVSVNSFGFGGTNAHAILESYAPPSGTLKLNHSSSAVFSPFVFSASSETSLMLYLESFCNYLRKHETTHNLRDIAYSLSVRRTRLPVSIALGATTADELRTKLEQRLESSKANPFGIRAIYRPGDSSKPRVLGIFTGQGAQWAQMGLDLINILQRRLDILPDGPVWSLLEELQKEASSSRVLEAAISQPLCTAIQILQLFAVVGHSSGEIAAAYAAGFISAEDAICIAYYRGLHSKLSRGHCGQRGAMIAVETSEDDARSLLGFPEFEGRAEIAAVNSSTSLTTVFQDEGKFVRLLKASSTKYLESLAALDIQAGHGKFDQDNVPRGTYWDANLVNPVLFQQGIETIELGPHPALKGPSLQTLKDKMSHSVPYIGLFQRGHPAITSVANVDIQSYDKFVSGHASAKFIKGLPTYTWDHEKEYWHETRFARAVRMRSDPVHPLLGHLTPDSTEQDMRWRHMLHVSEIPWLAGHRLQDMVVFPASAYVVSSPVKLIELIDLDLVSALSFEQEDSGVEIMVSLTNISRQQETIEAQFKYHAAPGKGIGPLELKATGCVRVYLGQPCQKILPVRPPRRPNLLTVREGKFYESVSKLEYQYSDSFRALERIERRLGAATGFISTSEQSCLLVHPAALDAAFDGGLTTMHIPRRIRQFAINPDLCMREKIKRKSLPFDAFQTRTLPHTNMVCNVDIYPSDLDYAMIQCRDLECVPLSQPTSMDDREIFANVVWNVAMPDPELVASSVHATAYQEKLVALLNRVSSFHLRTLNRDIPVDHSCRVEGPYVGLFNLASQSSISKSEEDTIDTIHIACEPYMGLIDIDIICRLGMDLIDVVKGTKLASQIIPPAWLDEWHSNGTGVATFTTYLARTLKQIMHRYPHMNILELSTGSKSTTKAILSEIAARFTTYTIAVPESTSFGQPQTWIEDDKNRVSFKSSDTSRDLRPQGFAGASYDLVVAPFSIQQTTNIADILRNVRLLLKPGGFLVVLGHMPSPSPFFNLISSVLQKVTPLTLVQWNSLLQNTGFSGVDTHTLEEGSMPFSVFVSQAVDNRISFLREPLSSSLSELTKGISIPELVILSGEDLRSTKLASQLSATLRPYCGDIRMARSLSSFINADLSQHTVVLSLLELSTSLFKKLNQARWEALKNIILHTGTLVWITQGRLADNPYANMMLGLIRGAVRDHPTLDYLLLDIGKAQSTDYHVIAEALIRHRAGIQWRQQYDIYCTVENELVLDKSGRILIPRLIMNEEMNNRYNSNRREISCRIQPSLQEIRISASKSRWDAELEPPACVQSCEIIGLRIAHSLVSSIRVTEFGYMFLAIGRSTASSDHTVVLSCKNSSIVYPPNELSITAAVSTGDEPRFLWLTAHHLLASTLLRGLSKDDKVLVHEPSTEFASLVATEAACRGVKPTFTTTDADHLAVQDSQWLVIHPGDLEPAIDDVLREGFAAFVNMTPQTGPKSVGERLANALPVHCRKDNLESLVGKESQNTLSHVGGIRTRLSKAIQWACTTLSQPLDRDMLAPLTVVDWFSSSEVSVKIRPVDSLVSFHADKTYWLVGLSGGLGLSLCEWMVQRGARYFAISSRNPKVEPSWLEDMRKKGVAIKVSACDITQRDHVVALHAEICANMPAIAGVAQGAMVLQDISIHDMSLDQLLRVTRPKVEGSIHLNALFQENTLDFFIFCSSVSSIIGNYGQANYAAANTFMASLAEQRRRQGLAASVIDIGPIIGVGYSAQAADGTAVGKLTLQTSGFAYISERDFHQMFGEAVLAGRPGIASIIELVSGVRKISRTAKQQPVWASWPRLGHFVQDNDRPEDPSTAAAKNNIPIKLKLSQATSRQQVYDIIWDAFADQLNLHFQLEFEKMSKRDLGPMRFDQMGADSLTAVEIRGWFMKTLGINIPVLKILNGGSVHELIVTATDTISSRLFPDVDGDSSQPADVSGPGTGESSTYGFHTSANNTYNVSTNTVSGTAVIKSIPVSFTQARFYPSGIFLQDKVGLNHTAWLRVIGKVDVERLKHAACAITEQHEILRTAFFDLDGKKMQHILKTGLLHLEQQPINSEDQVVKIAMAIQKNHVYNVASGETVRLLLLSRTTEDNFLVLGVHPLVLDATSLQTFLVWLAFHYSGLHATRRVKQFAEASEQRYADYATGKFDKELQYWREEFATAPPPLPLLSLSTVNERPALKAYGNVRAVCRIGVDTKATILNLCRRVRATPFHFYLATLRALLLLYTIGGEDVTIGVAESGRGYDAEDMNVIGPLYNVILVRLPSDRSTKFGNLLEVTRDKTYAALENSKLPYPMLVEKLNLQRNAEHFPFFQVFADYRTGQRMTVPFGENNKFCFMGFDLNVPYDVYLDTIDDPDGECIHDLFLRDDMFGKFEAEQLIKSYERLILAFAARTDTTVGGVDISESGPLVKSV